VIGQEGPPAACGLPPVYLGHFDHEHGDVVTVRAFVEPGVDDPECSTPAERDRVARSHGGLERARVGGCAVLVLELVGERPRSPSAWTGTEWRGQLSAWGGGPKACQNLVQRARKGPARWPELRSEAGEQVRTCGRGG
jgi:hypothetical protein